MQMLSANPQTEGGDSNGRVRRRTEGVCKPTGRKTIPTNKTPQHSQLLNQQTKSTHEEIDQQMNEQMVGGSREIRDGGEMNG